MLNESDIVQKLWGLCHVLRDDGITYHEYVVELTFLLFLKIADERTHRLRARRAFGGVAMCPGCGWEHLRNLRGAELLDAYKNLLMELSQTGISRIKTIFQDARTSIRSASALRKIVEEFDRVEWYRDGVDQFGAAYEGLLQKSAEESKAGAGQYFTPRALVDCIVQFVQPKPGERVQDPAAGTAGFLVAADRHIRNRTDDLACLTPAQRRFHRERAFYGLELVPSTCRLGRMNMLLHDLGGNLALGDALGEAGQLIQPANVILSNPPFGTQRAETPTRSDLLVRTSNKQLNFLQHIMLNLSPGGRAAVILPDNVLFESGAGVQIRRELLRTCRLHTVLRLPTGIFYAQNVRTHVLFFSREVAKPKAKDATEEVWFYDLRANMQRFTRRTPLKVSQFNDFLEAAGEDSYGYSRRRDTGERGRFRRFTRQDIAARGDNLNLAWLHGEERSLSGSTSEQLVGDVVLTLSDALARIEAVQASLRSLRR
jgi:type I restriction enzyme M protein